MTQYYMTVNSKRYRVTVHEDGTETYYPRLPKSVAESFERRKGEVLESGKCPELRTTTTFHKGRKTLLEQFNGDESMLRAFSKKYKKATGRSLGANDVYMSQLAEEEIDPNAVFTPSDGEEKVRKLIDKKIRKKQEEDATFIPLAEDLVQDKMLQYRQAGDTSPADELRAMVIDKHGQKKPGV